ncbi:MAG TPA: acyltransferase [Caulobacteraceae bacterium]|nr:acyltransferase [Caulobacteraceae bacterium]
MVEVSPTLSPPPGGRVLRNVQALRALAALMVVLVHLEFFAEQLVGDAALFAWGHAGVDLFFVISGFIMVYTTAGRPVTPQGFFGQRLARVVPLYWLVTLAVFAIALVAPQLMQATRADPVDLLKSLAFIPFEKSNGLTQPIAFVGWTLNYEMAFYALFALALLARRRIVGILLLMAVLAAAALLGAVLRPDDVFVEFYTEPIVLEFALGMGLGLLWRRLPAGGGLYLLALAPLFALIFAAPFLWPGVDRAFAAGLPAFGIVLAALALEKAGRTADAGWVQRLGDASYAIYLTHFFVTQAGVKVSEMLGLEGAALAWAMLVTLAAVIAVGLAVHLLVERPIARLLRGRRAAPPIRTAPCASA